MYTLCGPQPHSSQSCLISGSVIVHCPDLMMVLVMNITNQYYQDSETTSLFSSELAHLVSLSKFQLTFSDILYSLNTYFTL